MRDNLLAGLALCPFLAVMGLTMAYQAGVTWAWWATVPIIVGLGITAAIYIIRPSRRARPGGYIGKFRRTDGEIVHVARLPSGTLMVASETQPPQDLGPVSGPELARWQKLATEPDG